MNFLLLHNDKASPKSDIQLGADNNGSSRIRLAESSKTKLATGLAPKFLTRHQMGLGWWSQKT